MAEYVENIQQATLANDNFRQVLFTAEHSQLVVMSLKPGEDIGEEVHQVDQFIRLEQGSGLAVLNDQEHKIADDYAIVIPAGTKHNIINTGQNPMKLYTLYSPPEHLRDTVHATKEEAMSDEDRDKFDGQTSL